MRGDAEETPLQLKLNNLAELIAKAGGLSGLLLFIALMIRFFVQLKSDPDRYDESSQAKLTSTGLPMSKLNLSYKFLSFQSRLWSLLYRNACL